MSEPSEVPMSPGDNSTAENSAWELPAKLQSMEARLRKLTPRDDRLDRDRLMFLAGQASVESVSSDEARVLGSPFNPRVWPAAFAGMSSVAAALAVMLVLRSDHTAQLHRADVVQTESTRFRPAGPSDYAMLTTRDAHLGSIDRLFAQKEMQGPDSVEATTTSAEDEGIPILTPARLHDLFDDSKSVDRSFNGAARIRLIQGV
jgi:hypothetical protein